MFLDQRATFRPPILMLRILRVLVPRTLAGVLWPLYGTVWVVCPVPSIYLRSNQRTGTWPFLMQRDSWETSFLIIFFFFVLFYVDLSLRPKGVPDTTLFYALKSVVSWLIGFCFVSLTKSSLTACSLEESPWGVSIFNKVRRASLRKSPPSCC